MENVTLDYTNGTQHVSLGRRTPLENALTAAVVSLTAILAVLGNGTVIGLVLTDRHLRNQVSNLLITYLASVDMITAFGTMIPSIIAVVADEWPFSDFWCQLHCGINYWCVGGTQLSICLLTLDRFISVWKPLQYRTLVTRKRMILALIPLFLMGFVCSIRPVAQNWVVYDYYEIACNVDWYRPEVYAWINSMWSIFFVVPSIIIVGSNLYIVLAARNAHHGRSFATPTPQPLLPLSIEIAHRSIQTGGLAMQPTVPPNGQQQESTEVTSQGSPRIRTRLSHATQTSCDRCIENQDIDEFYIPEQTGQPEQEPGTGQDSTQSSRKPSRAKTGTSRTSGLLCCFWWNSSEGTLSQQNSINYTSFRYQTASPLKNRIYYSIIFVTVCFFVCLTPFSVVKLIKMWTRDNNSVPPGASLFATVLQYSNSCINPLIYGILRQDFRRAFCRLRSRLFPTN